jgi:hypothetical protein
MILQMAPGITMFATEHTIELTRPQDSMENLSSIVCSVANMVIETTLDCMENLGYKLESGPADLDRRYISLTYVMYSFSPTGVTEDIGPTQDHSSCLLF